MTLEAEIFALLQAECSTSQVSLPLADTFAVPSAAGGLAPVRGGDRELRKPLITQDR